MRSPKTLETAAGPVSFCPRCQHLALKEQREVAFWSALRDAVDVTIDLTPVEDEEETQ